MLMFVVITCSLKLLYSAILQAGANVNFQRSPGPTMLLAAVSVGSAAIVKFLLEAGADPNVHDGVLY
jgi:ankyrin repeat protein